MQNVRLSTSLSFIFAQDSYMAKKNKNEITFLWGDRDWDLKMSKKCWESSEKVWKILEKVFKSVKKLSRKSEKCVESVEKLLRRCWGSVEEVKGCKSEF